MSRRKFGWGGGIGVITTVFVLALAVAAYGSSSSRSKVASVSSAGASLVVANTSSVQKLNPVVMTNFLDFQALGLIYQPLVTLGKSLQVEPALATSWKYGDGGKTLTFQLRHGVTFDDGTALTSADVKATFAYIVKPSTGAAAASYLSNVKSVTTPSKYTVVLHFAHVDTSVLYGLTTQNLAILSTKAITAGTLAKTPDGTGPYVYSSYSPNNTFVVTRNDNYWGPKAKVAKITFRTIPNEQSIASAMQAGTVQVGLLTEPQVIEQLGSSSSLTVDKSLDLNYRALMIQSKGPLANVNARLAVQCAINRKAVLQASVLGDGKVVGPVPQGPFASKATSGTCATQNDAQAKKYLAKAGEPKGFSFTMLTSEELDGTSTAQATAIQAELAQVGIKVTIDNVAGSQYIQQWLKGKFEATLAENGANPSPYIMYGRYFAAGASLGVPAGFSSPTLKKLLAQADSSVSTATQGKLYTQFSNQLVDNAVWVWLFNAYDYYVLSSKVHGFSALPSGQLTSLATATVS